MSVPPIDHDPSLSRTASPADGNSPRSAGRGDDALEINRHEAVDPEVANAGAAGDVAEYCERKAEREFSESSQIEPAAHDVTQDLPDPSRAQRGGPAPVPAEDMQAADSHGGSGPDR